MVVVGVFIIIFLVVLAFLSNINQPIGFLLDFLTIRKVGIAQQNSATMGIAHPSLLTIFQKQFRIAILTYSPT
jgi:hypothetical protein